MEVVYRRCAGLDVHKKSVVVCRVTPDGSGGFRKDIRKFGTMTEDLLALSDWLRQGGRALALFQLLNPINHSDTPDSAMRYRVEPYVSAGDVYSVSPHVGRGGWTWYTGSSSWMYRSGLEAILGLHRAGNVLHISPSIPKNWPGYRITYHDGATLYEISVKNPNGVNRGAKQASLDGEILPDGGIPLTHDGSHHKVDVLIG